MAEEWRQITVEEWNQIALTADPAARPQWRLAAEEAVPASLDHVRDAAELAIGLLNDAHGRLPTFLVRHIFSRERDDANDNDGFPVDFLNAAGGEIEDLLQHRGRAGRVLAIYLAHYGPGVLWCGDLVLCGWGHHRVAGLRHANRALRWVRSAAASCARTAANPLNEDIAGLPSPLLTGQRWHDWMKESDRRVRRAMHEISVARQELQYLLQAVQMEGEHYHGIMSRFTD